MALQIRTSPPLAPGDGLTLGVTMNSRRILYLSKNFGFPLGGVRIAHHHVEMLRRNGFNASILLTTKETKGFFDSAVETLMLDADFRARRDDIFVVPEPWNDMLLKLKPVIGRTVVFCQNHFYVHHGLGSSRTYGDLGVSTVFCCGDVIARYLLDVIGEPRAPIVHNGVDLGLFRSAGTKLRQIAYMPRKMAKEAIHIKGTFQRLYPRWANVPWVPIEGVGEAEVARIMGESEVFLTLGRMEGLGLPPLEAMAAGALVVGFTGDGGEEFATPANGTWVAPDDWMGCARALDEALSTSVDNPEAASARRQQGLQTASRYSLEQMERELLAFWNEELSR